MFDALAGRLRASLARLGGKGRISAADLEAGLAEIRTALLDADVALGVTTSLIEAMRTRALEEKIIDSLGAGSRLVGLVHASLTEALGGSGRELDLREQIGRAHV